MKDFSKDHYRTLEVRQNASASDIKLAYRRLAKLYHPDLHPGDAAAEEKIKDINEAYGVLGDENERYAYDQYLLSTEKQAKAAAERKSTPRANQRTYTRKQQVSKEYRTYLKGELAIKYRGKPDEDMSPHVLRESWYRMNVTRADAVIESQHIYKDKVPGFIREILEHEHRFRLNFGVPVNCTVNDKDDLKFYRLNVTALTIPEPLLTNVTKHENESYGEIRGTFYGYVSEFKTHEEKTEVTECFGETGRQEERTENAVRYYRKEYFNTDCTTYWGNWVADIPVKTTRPTGNTQTRGAFVRKEYYYSNGTTYWGKWAYDKTIPRKATNGCADTFSSLIIWTGLLALIINFFPHLLILLPFIALPLLLRVLHKRSWAAMIFWGFIGLGSVCWSLSLLSANWEQVQRKAKYPEKIEKRVLVAHDRKGDPRRNDTLISHELSWKDYQGAVYHGRFWVNKKSFLEARQFKNTLEVPAGNKAGYNQVIYMLKEKDKNELGGLYRLLDSVVIINRLSKSRAAEMMVSFVQRIPYVLVLPQDCDASLYEDKYIKKYLAQPAALCDANERFGINTPVEFLGTLKGDCDTRTLLLYTILSHYQYDVVMLTSAAYGHSMIGINLPYTGAAYQYLDKRYAFWETTAPGAGPGMLPEELSNLNNWQISLKSKQ